MVNYHIQNFPHFLISGLKTFEISTSLSTISLLGMALSLIDWVQSLLPTAYNHDGYSMSQHWALKSKEEILWNIFHKLKKILFIFTLHIWCCAFIGLKIFSISFEVMWVVFIHFRLRLICIWEVFYDKSWEWRKKFIIIIIAIAHDWMQFMDGN